MACKIKKNKLSKKIQFSFLRKIRCAEGKKIIARQRLHGRDLNVKYGRIKQKLVKGWAGG